MIDYENLKNTVTSGLEKYCGCIVRRSNQNSPLPSYPYLSYTITTFMSANKGTYGVYADGKDRKQVTQTWSITAISGNDAESKMLANKARQWLEHIGSTYLNDNNVYVQSVGGITNRDNLLTTEYEYRNGFDVFFNVFDVVDNPIEEIGYIETAKINGEVVKERKSTEELLKEAENIIDIQNDALSRLNKRLEGVNSNE